jgi:hypothetical protein
MTTLLAADMASVIAGTIDTLPPADDRIYEAGKFGIGWLAAGVAAVVVAIAGLAWMLWPRRAAPVRAAAPQLVELRSRYLGHLDDLERQLLEHDITPRALHHELSRTLRRFAAEAGTAGATSMSAQDLDGAGLGPMAAAVRTYEHPQFEELPASDPWASLGIARAVVAGGELRRPHRTGAPS